MQISSLRIEGSFLMGSETARSSSNQYLKFPRRTPEYGVSLEVLYAVSVIYGRPIGKSRSSFGLSKKIYLKMG